MCIRDSGKLRGPHPLDHGVAILLAFQRGLFAVLPLVAGGQSREIARDGPVFFGLKGFDFAFALDDHRRGDRLYAPGGKPLADFAPQEGTCLLYTSLLAE